MYTTERTKIRPSRWSKEKQHYQPIRFTPYWLFFFLSWVSLPPTFVAAHPHVFVNAQVAIRLNEHNEIIELEQNWLFDPIFSAGVTLDFDKNHDRILDKDELATVAETIKTSLKEYHYFQSLKVDGEDIKIDPPTTLTAIMQNKRLSIHFSIAPKKTIKIDKNHHYRFSIYDPTFFVAVDFPKPQNFILMPLPSFCEMKMIKPDENETLTDDLANLTEDFFTDGEQSLKLAQSLATYLDVSCKSQTKSKK
ncbi:DUF1007 family protein [Bartonella sp. DGB2]|uniref:DUF1007 family protein n=1 Tax=Bartonella sp. DGB2 TaxID=3388426 RepID=UPI00398FDA90